MLCVLGGVCLCAAEPNSVSVQISSSRSSIRLGEPIVIKMVYRFKKPYVSNLTGKTPPELNHMMRYEVQTEDGRIQKGIYPGTLLLQGETGLEYKWYIAALV
ncbi:MAG: hypothetical protein QHH07_10450 [Sedimentisphaerales bacterium]|nr:hypothetical protein [Sedimentisphaerales bacterium]